MNRQIAPGSAPIVLSADGALRCPNEKSGRKHGPGRRLSWIALASLAGLSIADAPRAALAVSDEAPVAKTISQLGPATGGLVVDPANPRRMKYFNGGPAFISCVGEPEGFLYRGTKNANGTRSGDQATIINEIRARGLNCLYVIGFTDGNFGGDGAPGTNPFVNSNINGEIDADVLNQWYGWLHTLDAAGIVTYFNIYDDEIDVLPGKR